jgi:UDP-GlcNAc:undecaprenyl-phosphate/decaprenyl-phosphate GlcNAc-1-phosphate transferase
LIFSFLTIPPVIALAKGKKLLDIPNGRTVHKFATPTLGGIAIFAGFFFSNLIFSCNVSTPYLSIILAGCLLIFLVGMKDDIFVLSPTKKFITQFLAAIIVVVLADLRITSLHGVFGFNEIHYIFSVLISVFVIVAITNAINLIDGIDGLANWYLRWLVPC